MRARMCASFSVQSAQRGTSGSRTAPRARQTARDPRPAERSAFSPVAGIEPESERHHNKLSLQANNVDCSDPFV